MSAPEPFVSIRVEVGPFDAGREAKRLVEGRADVGALVSFTGLCRDEGGVLEALEIEHYPGMAEEEIGRVAAEALARWPLCGVLVIHRHGRIAPGEPIVLVATTSRHRAAAFAGAEFLMDFLKTRAPFWKRRRLAGASSNGGWVAANARDEASVERWREG